MSKTETTFTPTVKTMDGQVWFEIPSIDGYLRMSPEAARNVGTKLIQQAELAEGKTPSHVFVIPVGDADD